MNRTLTAAVALTAALGMAGVAQAQSSAGPSTSPNTMAPSTPSTNMNPPMTSQGGTPGPATMSAPGSAPSSTGNYGTQGPQANAQMNQGGQQASQSQIQQAQQQLKSEGLYRGTIDGVMGPETQTALTKFQREQGLPQSAQLDQQTLGRLTGGSTTNAGGAQPVSGQNMTPQYPAGTQNPATQNSTMPGNR